MKSESSQILPWHLYLTTTMETLIAFYLASFSIAMFFIHRGPNWLSLGILMVVLYLLVIVSCAMRIGQKLPLQAVMIIIPIAPFIALAIILTLIPVLQFF